jgi:superfamily II DNA or RNA helicase
MELYKHQQEAVDETLASMTFGSKNVIIEAPTSFGKSLVISELAKRVEGKVIILVNISILIEHIAEHLDEIGETYSILKAGRDRDFKPDEKIQIVMSQTFYARKDKLNLTANYIIQDERHKEYNTDRTQAVELNVNPDGVIGLTATPYDQQGFMLPNVCEIIRTVSVLELEEMGYLCPIKYFIPKWSEQIDYSSVKKTGTDYSTGDLEKITNKTNHMKLIIESMNKMKAKDHKGIVFCSSIEQSDTFAKLLQKHGYAAESYHSETENSAEKMHSFKTNKPIRIKNNLADEESLFNKEETHHELHTVKWIIAVDKISIGFSVKDITMMVSMRPTQVLSLFRQMIGRGCRTHPSKKYTLFLDCAQNVATHGFHYDPYVPPIRTGDKATDNASIKEAKQNLSLEDMQVTLTDELEEIDRKIYDKRIEEVKKSLIKEPCEMDLQQLVNSYTLAKDHLKIIEIAAEIMTRVNGQPVSKAGNEYNYDYKWICKGMQEKLDKYPEVSDRWVRALKTRARNIIKANTNFNALKYFLDFLEEKHIEDSRDYVAEAMEEKKRLNEEKIANEALEKIEQISGYYDIDEDDDIPF